MSIDKGSIKDFYIENSYGQLVVISTEVVWFTAAEGYLVYGSDQGDSGYEMVKQMIGQAIDDAEAAGMDWTQFDNDGDGHLDALNVIDAGSGAEEGNSIDPQKAQEALEKMTLLVDESTTKKEKIEATIELRKAKARLNAIA